MDAGYENVGEGYATLFTHTFSSEDESKAINFTPIITDEDGNYLGILKPTEFANYCQGVIDGIHEDDLNLQIGGVFTGKDAIEQAESEAQYIHELQEQYYSGPDGVVNLDKVREKLSEMNIEAREVDDIIADIASNGDVISLDSTMDTGALLDSLDQLSMLTIREDGLKLVDEEAFSALLRNLDYTEEEIEAFYNKLDGYDDISFVDKDGNFIDTKQAIESATKSAKKQKNTVQENIELFRELNKTAGELDPSSEEFITVTQQIEDLKAYFDTLPEAVKRAFNIDTSLFDTGMASITETLADYEQAVLNLQSKTTLFEKGFIDAEELASARAEVDNFFSEAEKKEIKAKFGIDIESAKQQILDGTFEIPDISVNVETEDATQALANVVAEAENVGVAVGNAAAKRLGTFGYRSTINAIDSVISKINELNRTRISIKVPTLSGGIPGSGLSDTQQRIINGGSSAYGTSDARGGPTLVGELGREIVVSNGRFYTVGEHGAEIVNLKAGDIVFNNQDTERIFGGRPGARGLALAEGNVRLTGKNYGQAFVGGNSIGMGPKPSSPSKGNTTTKVTVKTEADADLSDALKEELDKLKEELEEIIGNFEHNIFLEQRNGKNLDKIIANYKAMQEET